MAENRYTLTELMTVAAAREIGDGEVVFAQATRTGLRWWSAVRRDAAGPSREQRPSPAAACGCCRCSPRAEMPRVSVVIKYAAQNH